MEEESLQQPTETIESNKKEDPECRNEEEEEAEAEAEMSKERKEDEDEDENEDEEEFYERIEAPKFVDLTKPDPVRPDDRYWFCARVGCDRKHEEEIDPEEISKNFVLRVLAARSPNIKLRKALNGKNSSMKKCPLSAPAKPSKSRIPRLAMVSSISRNIFDPKPKVRPAPNVSSTPMAKSRQVAAKYMTTPRNKRCSPNPSSFRSVQNPKPTTANVPKNRTVAKALVFNSPKKAISLKKSVELHMPLKKICQGMKRLEITSEKKVSKDIRSNIKKASNDDSSRRHLRVFKGDKKSKDLLPSKSCKEQEHKSYRSTKTPSKKTLTEVAEKESSNMDGSPLEEASRINGGNGPEEECLPSDSTQKEASQTSEEPQSGGNSGTLLSDPSRCEMNSLPDVEDKENMGSSEDHSSEVAGPDCGTMDVDNKENNLNSEENNNREISNKNDQPVKKILGCQETMKNKVVQTLDKNLKGGLAANCAGPGPAVVKYKKPKPTNVKPFRLRTDERGILKEAILERKLHSQAPGKEAAKDATGIIKRTVHSQTNEKVYAEQSKCNGDNVEECRKEPGGSKLATQSQPESTQRRPKSINSPLARTENCLRTRSPYLQRQPLGLGVASPGSGKAMKPGQQLGVIKEKSSKLIKQLTEVKKVDGNNVKEAGSNTRVASASRSTSRGKRPVTIAKEPNFHSSHLPRSCTKKIA